MVYCLTTVLANILRGVGIFSLTGIRLEIIVGAETVWVVVVCVVCRSTAVTSWTVVAVGSYAVEGSGTVVAI